MAIEKKSLKDIQTPVRAAFQKARDVISKNSLDYGIELLRDLLKCDPGFVDARVLLRDAESRKLAGMNGLKKFLGNLKMNKFIIQGRACLSKNPRDAMAYAEDALAALPCSPSALKLLADAALAAEAPFIATSALELISELNPEDEENLTTLAGIYESLGDGLNVLKIRQMQANRHPDDLEIQGALRAAAAMATMEKGRWNDKGGDFQKHMESAKDKTEDLERGDRIIRSADDIREMIEHYEKSVAAGDESIDLRRKLAELYQRADRHADSIKAYEWIVQKMGTLDPAIDKAIEKSTVAMEQDKINRIKAANGSQDEINAIQQGIFNYRLQRYEERVKNYPNDLQLRFDLAELYWEGGMVDKALEQFQVAQRNPARRLSAIVYLGRCFSAKNQCDMAIEQFNKAIQEMPIMDKEKMNAVYHLGCTYEAMKDMENAMHCFKQIYAVNVNYLDVSQRMDAFYKSQQN